MVNARKDQCCYNFHVVGNKCEPCSPGFFGNNCVTACPNGTYGNLCVNICEKCTKSECHPVYGCEKPEISTLELTSQIYQTTPFLSTYREKSTRKSVKSTRSSPQIFWSTLKHVSISTRLTTPSLKGEDNNNNTVIIAVGGAITLCLVILIIQVGYKQILQCKRKKRRLTTKQDHTQETYEEIPEIDLDSRRRKDESKEKNKYNILNRVPELPGRGYHEIQQIQISEETRSGGTVHSDSSGESYISPNENAPLHTYTPVIDSNYDDVREMAESGNDNYLDPVIEITPEIHVPSAEQAHSDSSHGSTQYNDIALPRDPVCVNRMDRIGQIFDGTNMYLDVTNK
ncbi:uncharacterized protein LOC133173846 [Saccostrea echinata]|uniref:uncharacterized protein LOC133173846 n=1 Tax=Saccostrea echinata TaxID=191078 RepID=UPI002A8365C5|nr:uncharacterized protein LOC133173846 [Saccostrea echinata]